VQLWLNLIAGEIVAVVESFGLVLNISTGILGVTVVAMSNTLGDWFSSTWFRKLVKQSPCSLSVVRLQILPSVRRGIRRWEWPRASEAHL
jgi:hypothetical protein